MRRALLTIGLLALAACSETSTDPASSTTPTAEQLTTSVPGTSTTVGNFPKFSYPNFMTASPQELAPGAIVEVTYTPPDASRGSRIAIYGVTDSIRPVFIVEVVSPGSGFAGRVDDLRQDPGAPWTLPDDERTAATPDVVPIPATIEPGTYALCDSADKTRCVQITVTD